MTLRRLHPFRLVAALLVVLGIIVVPTSTAVFAQASTAANGLEITPVLAELSLDKGEVRTVDIKVHNITASDLFFETIVNDFGAKDETGTPSIVLDEDVAPLSTSIKTWVTNVPAFALAPNESTTVKAVITVPNNAEPGGHYGVIRFAGHGKQTDTGNVGQIASAGTLILITVKGNVHESLQLASFESTKDGKQSSMFESGPITFVSRFTNDGTVHVKPIGQINIKDTFGNSVATLPVNPTKGNVLPNSTRRFESTLDKSWLFGHYTADLAVAYGDNGQAIVNTISFWVIPWRIVIVGILLLVTFIYIARKVIQRYNQYIISKDRQKNKDSKKKRES